MAEETSSKDDDELQKACRDGNIEAVQKLLNSGADVNYTTDCGLFALDEASREGHLEIVRLLIQNGADVNLSTPYGFALKEACRKNHFEVVCELLDAGANVNVKTSCDSALEEACKRGHLEIVKELIKRGADVNLQTEYSFPLKEACRKGHLNIVKELIKTKGNVIQQTDLGYSIQEAIEIGQVGIVQELLKVAPGLKDQDLIEFNKRKIADTLKKEELNVCRLARMYKIYEILTDKTKEEIMKIMKEKLEKETGPREMDFRLAINYYIINLNEDTEEQSGRHPGTLNQRLLGRISRRMYLEDYSFLMKCLGFTTEEIDQLTYTYRTEDLILRLLLYWRRNKTATLEALEDAYFNTTGDTLVLEDILAPRDKWRKELPKDSLRQALSKASDAEVDKICFFVGRKYLSLGLELQFKEENINQYQSDFMKCASITRHIITKWIAREGNQANWMALGDAMYEVGADVNCILQKFPLQKSTVLKEDTEDEDDDKILSEAFDRGSEKDYRIRVNFVGHLAAGKTSLMLQMLLEDFDPSKITSTNGIDVSVGNCCVDIESGLWYKEGWTSEQDILHRVRVILHSAPLLPMTIDQELNTKQIFEKDSEQPENKNKNVPADQDTTIQPDQIEEKQSILIFTREETTTAKILPTITDKKRVQEILKKAKEMESGRNENQVFVRGFDYAGQCVFYTVHQLFFSQRGVNIIVVDGSRNFNGHVGDEDCRQMGGKIGNKTAKEFFKFWAMSLRFSLHNHEQKQVIVVITHKDLVDDPMRLDEIEFDIKETIQEMKMTKMFVDKPFRINCNDKNDPETPKLRIKILEISKQFDDWGKKMPSKWLFLEDKLMKVKSDGNRIIKLDELLHLNSTSTKPLSSHKEILLFLKTRHQLGEIMYYEDEGLRDLVILDPQWLIDSLKAVITASCFWLGGFKEELKIFSQTAILHKTVLEEIWKKTDEKGKNRFFEFRDQLILLMVKLDLISYPKKYNEDGKNVTSSYFVVPCMLSSAPEHFLQGYRIDAKSKNIPIVFKFHDDFLPSSIVYRLLAACNMRYGIREESESTKEKASATITIHSDAAVFKVGASHYLILEYRGCCIIADVVSMRLETTDPGICQGVREFLDDTLRCIIAPHKSYVKYSVKVSCGKGVEFGEFGLLNLDTVLQNTELECENHRPQQPHVVQLQTIKEHWFVMRKRRPSFSREEQSGRHPGTLTQFLIGRISRQMYPKNFTIEFQKHLDLEAKLIQQLEFAYEHQDLLLRLLLYWLKNKTVTLKALNNVYSALGGETLVIEEMLAPRNDWRKELPEDSLLQALSKASDEEMDYICDLIGSKYLPFGLELQFKEENIDQYKSDFVRCHSITKHIITEWIAREGDQANWMALGDALSEIGAGVGYIIDKFQPQKSTEVK